MRTSQERMAQWEQRDGTTKILNLIPEREYQELNVAEEQLRVWLPHPAKLALEAISERRGISMTAHLTEYFASFLYGYYELMRMREMKTGLYEPLNVKCSKMSVGQPELPNLGKNIFALKIYVPEKIKQALQEHAGRANMTLGEFARSLICTHLFGREYGPIALVELNTGEKSVANDWEVIDEANEYDDEIF